MTELLPRQCALVMSSTCYGALEIVGLLLLLLLYGGQWRRQNFAPGGEAPGTGSEVRSDEKSSRSESRPALGLLKRIRLKFFLQQPAVASFQPNIGGSNISYSTTSPSSLL